MIFGLCLVVGSRKRVSSYLGLVSSVYLNPTVDTHTESGYQCTSLQTLPSYPHCEIPENADLQILYCTLSKSVLQNQGHSVQSIDIQSNRYQVRLSVRALTQRSKYICVRCSRQGWVLDLDSTGNRNLNVLKLVAQRLCLDEPTNMPKYQQIVVIYSP